MTMPQRGLRNDPRNKRSTAHPSWRGALLAALLSTLFTVGCGPNEPESERLGETGRTFRARLTLLNKTHEFHQVEFRQLADETRLDCERVADSPARYLSREDFGPRRKRNLFSGERMALGVKVPGQLPPLLEESACRAALVSVDGAPEILAFWDGGLRTKSFVEYPRGSKTDMGGPQTVALTADYSRTSNGPLHEFGYRPCRDGGICGRSGRWEAAEAPEGVEYGWSQNGTPKRFVSFGETRSDGSSQPKSCRRLIDGRRLEWNEPPAERRTVEQIQRDDDGCHDIVWSRIGASTPKLEYFELCAPWAVVSKLRPSSPSGRVRLELEETTDYDAPHLPHQGLRIRLAERSARGETVRNGSLYLTRGTGGLPTLPDAEFRPDIPENCKPQTTRCGGTELPARALLVTSAAEYELEPGRVVEVGENRAVHPVRAVHRPVVRRAESCESAEPEPIDRVLDGRTGLFVEAATVVGLSGPTD